MSIKASVSDGVFLGDDGVFQECCCHVAFLSLKRASDGESIIVAIEDAGNEGRVMWVKEIDPRSGGNGFYDGVSTSLWWHEDLFLSFRPDSVSSPSVLRLNQRTGVVVNSLALTTITGSDLLSQPGIAVNLAGQVYVCDVGTHDANGRDMYRLTKALAISSQEQIGSSLGPVLGRPFSAMAFVGRQRLVSISGDGPAISGRFDCFRLNPAPPFDPFVSFNEYRWDTLDGGGAPNVHRGGPDVLIAESGGTLYNHTSFNGPKTVVSSVRGTFANNRTTAFADGNVWVPAKGNAVRKFDLGGPTLLYAKVLGTDFLTSGTWGASSSRIDVLRHGEDLWLLVRDINAANKRAVLLVVREGGEDGTEWIEKWQIDLMTDGDVDWADPSNADYWRGWCLNTHGQGFDD